MKVEEIDHDTLVVSHSGRRFARWLAIGWILFAVIGIYQGLTSAEGVYSEGVKGAVAACVMLVAMYVIFFESVSFRFERRRQRLFWRRRRSWGARRGELAFDRIRAVRTESPLGDEGIPSRRIVLDLVDAKPLPLSTSYTTDAGDVQLQLAARLREFIATQPSQQPLEDELRAMLAAGRNIDAVRLLREVEGLTLTAAQKRVGELSAPR